MYLCNTKANSCLVVKPGSLVPTQETGYNCADLHEGLVIVHLESKACKNSELNHTWSNGALELAHLTLVSIPHIQDQGVLVLASLKEGVGGQVSAVIFRIVLKV